MGAKNLPPKAGSGGVEKRCIPVVLAVLPPKQRKKTVISICPALNAAPFLE
jgi:hypothetical protein